MVSRMNDKFLLQTEIVVRCLKCGVKNRIGRANLQKKALCGVCGASLEEIIISCLYCGKKNRLAKKDEMSVRQLKCGACGKPLIDDDKMAEK